MREVRAALEHSDGLAVLSLSDDGPGVPEDSREALLLFYREGQSSQQVAILLGITDVTERAHVLETGLLQPTPAPALGAEWRSLQSALAALQRHSDPVLKAAQAPGAKFDYDTPVEGLQVVDAHTLRFVLESTYRRGLPVVGFSPATVAASIGVRTVALMRGDWARALMRAWVGSRSGSGDT